MKRTLKNGLSVWILAGCAGLAAAEPAVPPVEGLDRLASWTEGVKQADSATDPLVVVCFGDSNTEGFSWTAALRESLQGCYGERGYGYHSFGPRIPVPDGPKVEKQGTWKDQRVGPELPPTPWFAPDLLWTATDDPAASIAVAFPKGNWGGSADSLSRLYEPRQRFRVHYQTGPGQGSFGIYLGEGEVARIDTASGTPGYGISDPFVSDAFRIAGIRGAVTLLGFDGVREHYLQGRSRLKGGVRVHALGRSWGQAAHFCRIEQAAFDRLMPALKPDLVAILLGTNDMHNEGIPDRYRNNLETLVRKIRQAAPGVGVLVIACPEAGQTREGYATQYRDLAASVARENGCAFWPLTDLVGPRSRDWSREGFFGDGLHYNRLGGSLVSRLLLLQLGFDLNDLRHYPALGREAEPPASPEVAIPRVKTADDLAGAEPFVIWRHDRRAAELRLGMAGDSLAVLARVFGPADGDGTELYVATSPTGAVRQFVIRRGAVSLHENGRGLEAPRVAPQVIPLDPAGYEWRGLVPLSALGLEAGAKAFRLEAAAVTSPAKEAPGEFTRLFGVRPDGGAFRDARQSARVTVKD